MAKNPIGAALAEKAWEARRQHEKEMELILMEVIMNSGKRICVEDIDCLNFWMNYFGCCYPNGYDDSNDISVSELMEELYTEEVGNWWDQFTGYYEGVLDESDGYLDNPATLEEELLQDKILKIEFHPGDILYFINDEQIGSTGPHYKLQTIPYEKVEQLLSLKRDCSFICSFCRLLLWRRKRCSLSEIRLWNR